MTIGLVRVYHREEGWGVIDSDRCPDGCWVHFSAINADGYRSLEAGDVVSFEFVERDQDGFEFVADDVTVVSGRTLSS